MTQPLARRALLRPDPRGEFEAACRDQPGSDACKEFLAPEACAEGNFFDEFPDEPLAYPFSCAGVLAANPCHEMPESEGCDLFLGQPCFLDPRVPACLIYLQDFRARQCSFDPPYSDPPMSLECRVLLAAFNDFCEVRPKFCNPPYGGSRELLAFVDDEAGGGGGSGGGGGDGDGSGDGSDGGGGGGRGGSDDDEPGGGLAEIDPGLRGDLGESDPVVSDSRRVARKLPFTGLGLDWIGLLGLALAVAGFGLWSSCRAAARRRRAGRLRLAVVLLGLACAGVLGAAQTASAYDIDPDVIRWPFDTITYYVDEAPADARGPIARGIEGWNRGNTGWRFEPAPSLDAADIRVRVILSGVERHRCRGLSQYGHAGTGGIRRSVLIYGFCPDPGLVALAIAHELGHVLGLGDENQTCSIMNTSFAGRGRDIRPGRCPRGRDYLRDPIQDDDRAGAGAMYERSHALPSSLCNPSDRLPLWANDPACKYLYDCRGVEGSNLVYDLAGMYFDCANVLQVVRVRERPPVALRKARRETRRRAMPAQAPEWYVGTTSQGGLVQFRVSEQSVREFQFGVRFSCTDLAGNPVRRPNPFLPANRRFDNVETLGPFPALPLEGGVRFLQRLSDPSGYAFYALGAVREGDQWQGVLRIRESYIRGGRRTLFAMPHPDHTVKCQTGLVTFTAERVTAARGGRARRSALEGWLPKAARRLR